MTKPYYITYYCGFPIDSSWKEKYQEARECGFNLMQVELGDVQKKQEILRFCEEKGWRASLSDSRILDLVYNNWEENLKNSEKIENVVKSVCEDFRDFPALYRYNIIDEPEAGKFPLLAKIVEMFRKYDPAHICYINLFPNYAELELLETSTYEEYLRQFVEIVKPDILSYDHYHLRTDNRPDEDITITDIETARAYAAKLNRIDRVGFFNNLELVRRIGLENSIPYMLIVLLTEHGENRYLLPEEISFEVYQTLVYGCSGLSYFRYWASEERPYPYWRDQNSIVSDDILCQHYYDVQAINAEIRGIGECIANTTSEAVFHIGEEADNVEFFKGYGEIRNISGGRYSVGFYGDGSFLIANKDYLQPSICTVETDAAIELWDPKTSAFVLVSEKQFTIPAGAGVYLRKV